ncbi:MAG TPA: glycosyltransferase family 2 protein, partial [Victivallales bacterium]|nr:glycosyltransferase family 2 protein [Victivallales bacterium]
MNYLLDFVFYYPLTMSFVWMSGAFIFAFFREKKFFGTKPELKEYPLVSILIPCHNEEDCIEDTITYLQYQKYPNFEIIAVDDASKDKTYEILLKLQKKFKNLRIIRLMSNQGKGTGLNMAMMASKGEILVCIDADALLEVDAVEYMVWHFQSSPRVGAVTGNPKVRNRTTLMGKIQVGEYSTIIGMIKRAQRIL